MSAGLAMPRWATPQPILTIIATTRCAIKPGLSLMTTTGLTVGGNEPMGRMAKFRISSRRHH
jgi:hypothetical protein